MPEAELTIVLVSDRGITRLNRTYLGRDAPTDVLAFSMREGPGSNVNPSLLGDVVISADSAARQARQRGNSLQEEIELLVVHGVLHLLGYDHTGTPKEAARMFRKQRALLRKLRAHERPSVGF